MQILKQDNFYCNGKIYKAGDIIPDSINVANLVKKGLVEVVADKKAQSKPKPAPIVQTNEVKAADNGN